MLYVFEKDRSEWPQGGVRPGLFWLKVKAATCLALGRYGDDWVAVSDRLVPVHMTPMVVVQSWDGPCASWCETMVTDDWTHWRVYEVRNGI